jgi:putative ABC transport system substrate-binding protein
MSGLPSDPATISALQALVEGLREHGWAEGRNFSLQARYAGPDPARFPELAGELVGLKVDVIMTANTQALDAARHKTTTMPIVMAGVTNPVRLGFVASLARPGGNITGVVSQLETVVGKTFELLKEIKPEIERVGIIYSPDNVASAATFKAQQEEMAPRLGLIILPIPVSKPDDFDQAFATIARERPHALQVHPTPVVFAHRAKIAAFAIEQRLPTASGFAVLTRDGLLLSYGYNPAASWRRAAPYVDRIFKGANPAELPVEQVDQFELVINLKTARALAITIPPTLLARADEVIE